MTQLQIKMTYTTPERLRRVVEDGREFVERIPQHPTRPARASDWNTWWEDAMDITTDFENGDAYLAAIYRLA